LVVRFAWRQQQASGIGLIGVVAMAASELETYAFSADISQLMSLIINAFYSNKEIFLRELVSNASDAMDKIQYQKGEKLDVQPDMYVKISANRDEKTITVEDAGIAMTRDDLVNNLGTIAKSGTKAFMEYVSAGADMTMIGQFGVGFYSAFLVSEKVRVVSKSFDDEQYVWESTAGGTFVVWKDEKFEHGVITRGTKVICYLKDDQLDLLETDRLKGLVLKHSAFVGYPISINMEYRKEEDVPDSEEKVVTVTHKWELMNKNKPCWLRPAEDVTHEEYAELYKFLAEDWEEHLAVKHVMQSGQVDYKALLYCPRNPPKDMFDMGKMSHRFSIRLYVRRVFIKEFNDLIPKWMGFIKGIVDSDDMPLNISREQLQQNAILKHIKTGLQKSVFQMFEGMQKDKDQYRVFYDSFAQCLKLGVYEDHANRAQILPLLRYHSSKSGEGIVSLDEYVSRMKPGQNHILFISGRNRRDAARSPYIEGLKRDGYEIIYMIDPVDEYAIQFMKEYQGKEFMSCQNINAVALLGVGRSEEDKKAELEPLRRRIAEVLSDKVSRVVFAEKVTSDSCAKLVDSGDGNGPVMELNYKHGLLKEMAKHNESNGDTQDLVLLLHQVALLKEDKEDGDEEERAAACEKCQKLIGVLNAAEQDDCPDDVPVFTCKIDEQKTEAKPSKAKKQDTLISCGSLVRIVKADVARRALISFVDEDAGTVDVMYSMADGTEQDEEGVPIKAVHALLPFETDEAAKACERSRFKESFFKAASAAKEEGNQLFKLKDYEAAIERYTMMVDGFHGYPRKPGTQVLIVGKENEKRSLLTKAVMSVDADGQCEFLSGEEAASNVTFPILQELLPLETAAFMNRARCYQGLGMQTAAGQDLTVVLGLWGAADKRMMDADPEMKEAEAKGLYTAQYLRAKSRLARGFVKQASQDIKEALARNPPANIVKQLKQLKVDVQTALDEHKRVNGPLARELAKVSIGIRGMPTASATPF